MRWLPLITLATLGCTTGSAAPQTVAPVLRESDSARQLRALMTSPPRHGVLEVTPEVLQLRLAHGQRSRPFIGLERSAHMLGCASTPIVPSGASERTDLWWLFQNAEHAVALQVTPHRIDAWFWDAERSCAVRMNALPAASDLTSPPPDYYKADDAQVAYRWSQSTTPFRSYRRLPDSEAPGVTGDDSSDFVAQTDGAEQLIVTSSYMAIRAADGRLLLDDHFEIDPDWPCYDAQLTVFEEADGDLYAISSFETFGAATDCSAVGGDNRYQSTYSKWNPELGRFVPDFRTREHTHPIHRGGESSTSVTEYHVGVAGGTLRVLRRAATRYTESRQCAELQQVVPDCHHEHACWHWTSTNEQTTELQLRTGDGARIELGAAKTSTRDAGSDCE